MQLPMAAETERPQMRNETVRILLEGSEEAPRTLRVHFGAFMGELMALGDPDELHLAELLAGADLLRALDSETDRFGSAAPGVSEAAEFTEKVLAITDEAFSAAHELLGESDWDPLAAALHPREAAADAVHCLLDDGLHRAIALALLSCPPAEAQDATLGAEFV